MVIPVVPRLRECRNSADECLQALNHLVAAAKKRPGETSGLRIEPCPAGETVERAAGRCLRGRDPALDILRLD
jgi:hypothetical protein